MAGAAPAEPFTVELRNAAAGRHQLIMQLADQPRVHIRLVQQGRVYATDAVLTPYAQATIAVDVGADGVVILGAYDSRGRTHNQRFDAPAGGAAAGGAPAGAPPAAGANDGPGRLGTLLTVIDTVLALQGQAFNLRVEQKRLLAAVRAYYDEDLRLSRSGNALVRQTDADLEQAKAEIEARAKQLSDQVASISVMVEGAAAVHIDAGGQGLMPTRSQAQDKLEGLHARYKALRAAAEGLRDSLIQLKSMVREAENPAPHVQSLPEAADILAGAARAWAEIRKITVELH